MTVQGWKGTAYADAAGLDALAAGELGGRSRTTLLSPFDSLVWHRGRTARLFDFDYLMELYVPQEQRLHGYFTMPVLHGGRLVARVDPKREKDVLTARQVTFEVGPRGGVPASAVAGTAVGAARGGPLGRLRVGRARAGGAGVGGAGADRGAGRGLSRRTIESLPTPSEESRCRARSSARSRSPRPRAGCGRSWSTSRRCPAGRRR